ncbi:uncharacterized protein G2W53_029575 [Senna tora]|uniref:Uncharacterized protein n=1 Tax=Senna tora TaxID=362788 RepID=A0A834T5T4_9FABA|nr:uncharacterized protein G2W53_029575 [Senna tora]
MAQSFNLHMNFVVLLWSNLIPAISIISNEKARELTRKSGKKIGAKQTQKEKWEFRETQIEVIR